MSAYIDQISSLGPKAWFRFNETSGTPVNFGSTTTTFAGISNWKDGASHPGPSLNQPSSVDGTSVSFDGYQAYTLAPWSNFEIFNDKSFSMELWFKASTTLPQFGGWLYHFNGEYAQQLSLEVLGLDSSVSDRGKLEFIFPTSTNGFASYKTTNTYNDNLWHHVVFTYNTTSRKIYIDGGLVSSATITTPSQFNFDSWNYTDDRPGVRSIGGRNFYDNNTSEILALDGFIGSIDEFALYDYELTAVEINANYVYGTAVYVNDTVATVNALMVNPTLTTVINYAADPATASATFPEALQNDIDLPLLLETYMHSLANSGYLEQWYKFDEFKNIINYGSGGSSVWQFTGDAESLTQSGVQFGGALGVTGSSNDGRVFAQATNVELAVANPEISDSNYVAGVWIKTPSSITSGRRDIWSATDENGRGPSVYTGGGTNDNTITFNLQTSNGSHQIIGTTNVMDGNWHHIACKQNDTAMELFIDGVSEGTQTANGNLMGTATVLGFGNNDATAFGGDKVLISSFFIGNTTNITTGVLTDIYDAGIGELQATAIMKQPAFKSNSAFNDYIESEFPLIDFRFNESSGTPANFGSIDLTPGFANTSYLLGEPALDGKAVKFTDRDTTFKATYSLDSGTVSTDDKVTMGILFKSNTISLAHPLMGFGGFLVNNFPSAGIGLTLIMNTNGTLAVRSGNADGTFGTNTGSVNYGDSQWHLAIVVQDTTDLLLYVDGKLEFTADNGGTAFTDSGEFAVSGFPGVTSGSNANLVKFIDNAFVTAGAFTANEVFDAWQSLRLVMDTTATAEFLMPTVEAGFGPTVTVDPMIGSGLFEMPAFSLGISLAANTLNASSLIQHPNYVAEQFIDANYAHTAATCSALFHDPQIQIGEIHSAASMDADALMVHPISTGGGSIAVPSATALDATLVMPGIVAVKGARVIASPMNSNAIFPLPPKYVQLSDDDWYLRLYGAHFDGAKEFIQGLVGNLPNSSSTAPISGGFLTFFDDVVADMTATTTVNTIESELGQFAFVEADEYSFDDNGDLVPLETTGNLSRATATRQSNTPQSILSAGLYDPYERKAVRITNIEFPFPGTDKAFSERPYNIEFSIRTTKSDQVLTHGFYSSPTVNTRKIGVIGLFDGKIYLTEDYFTPSGFSFRGGATGSTTAPHPKNFKNRAQYMLGRKNIADGNWHHIIIQKGYSDGRAQIWIDGQLDKQLITPNAGIPGFDGWNSLRPYILGFNSDDELLNSDFETSAWNYYPGRFIDERTINLNYMAYQKSKPIKVQPMTAIAEATQDHLAQGNRSRALLLYWWPKTSKGSTYLLPFGKQYKSTFDQELTTQDSKLEPPQDYQGWDIFPVSVVGDFKGSSSDVVKQSTLVVDNAYRNEITGSRRYLDIVKDLDLTQIDAIFFANYPESSEDLDSYIREEYADEYFQLKEVALYEDFLKSLRAAVDKGLSLFVTNERLALDLKIINKAETVPLFDELVNNEIDFSDFRAPVLTGRTAFDGGLNKYVYNGPDDADDPIQPLSGGQDSAYWHDTFNNMRHRVVNTEMLLTDDASYIHTDQASYKHSDTIDFGGVNRHYNRFEYKMNGLQPGDEFIFGNFRDKTYLGNSRSRQNSIRAIPFQDVNAGKVITAQPLNYWKKNTLTPNPYANYAHSIAINENDVLDGRPVGGKIFVCFSEVFWDKTNEYFKVDLNQDYWIDIAFDNGIITEAERDELKSSASTAYLGPDSPVEPETIKTKKYWSYNGDYNFMQQLSSDAYTGILGLLFDDDERIERVSSTRKGLPSSTRNRDKLGRFASGSGVGGSGGVFAQIVTGHSSPTMNIYAPSLLTRAFWWLSDRIRPTGLVYRSEAMTVNATMPNGLARPDKEVSVNVEAMIANANIGNVLQSTLKSVSILSLPMIATARIVELGNNILASPMIAISSDLTHGVVTFGEDPVILKIHNIEPVLYIRGAKTT